MSAAELPLGPGPLVPEGVPPASRGLDGLFEVAPTPGPWHTDGDVVWAGIAAPGICMTVEPPADVHFVERPEAERHANARLIASAPELLAALRGLLQLQEQRDYRRGTPYRDVRLDTARAVIARAEGRS